MDNKSYIGLYIKTNDDQVFKVTPDHYLQISPWKDGDDRRVYEFENDDYHIISYDTACMIVNKQFKEIDETWEHNNKKYIARKSSLSADETAAIISSLPSHEVIVNMKSAIKRMDDDTQISIQNDTLELKMIRHNGKIHYVLLVKKFLPRVQLYDVFGNFCKWANIKNIKPIFCETDKRYI